MSKHGEKYTRELLAEAVASSSSIAGVLRHLGIPQAGGTHAHVARKIRVYEIDTAHFTGSVHNKGLSALNRKTLAEILVVLPPGSARPKRPQLLRAMLESGLKYQCSCGNVGEWNGEKLVLEIDHVDGDWLNNSLDNLQFLCPNCHSQQKHSNMPHKYRTK